jgi:chromate reductase
LVASPEYNGQLTPYLKNIIDWVSRLAYIDPTFENPFVDKPILLCSASTGSSGGAMGIPSARALFGYVGAIVFGETLCVSYAHQSWTEAGYFFEDDFENRIQSLSQRFAEHAERFRANKQD